MTNYYLGIDIGASKSHALIADETGRALGFGKAGSGNYEVIGYDGFQKVLHQITDEALVTAGVSKAQIKGAGYGVAGYDWEIDYSPILKITQTLSLDVPYAIVNDAVIGLLAGTSAGWGVSVVAGTSCNCRGRDAYGREGRVTGCGPNFGEYGGGYELVTKAIKAVSRAWSLRGPQTSITQAFIHYVGAADAEDLLQGLSRHRYRLPSSASLLVFDAALNGDQVAQDLLRWSGRELGNLAVGVIRQLELEALDFEVVLAGNYYKGSPLVVETMQEVIYAVAPKAQMVHLTAPPVVGALLLAMESASLDYLSVRDLLIETTSSLLDSSA